MTTNVGSVDRLLRGLVGLALIAVPLLDLFDIWSSTALAYGSMAVGLVLVLTSLFRFCPLYRIVGFSSCRA